MTLRRSIVRCASWGLAAVAVCAAVHAQSGAQTFRATTELVQLDVVVLDRQRRPVTGLSAADFDVSFDGERQPIEVFVPISLPVAGAGPSSAGEDSSGARPVPSVARDVVPNARSEDGRLVTILMDRTIPMESGTVAARTIAGAIVDSLGPGDLAAVVRDTGFANDGPQSNFTRDRALLRAAIDAPFVGLVNPPQMSFRGLSRSQPNLTDTGDCLCGLCALESLERAALAMREETRRQKLIVFIGSDIVVQTSGDPCTLHVKVARERVFHALDLANVTVHVVDPTGLESLTRGADSFPWDQARRAATTLVRQGNLRVFPDYTGGRTILNTNTPQAMVSAIFAESQSYYLIGVSRPPNASSDQQRKIRVTIRNRSGLEVRARAGYYAAVAAEAIAPADQ